MIPFLALSNEQKNHEKLQKQIQLESAPSFEVLSQICTPNELLGLELLTNEVQKRRLISKVFFRDPQLQESLVP